MERQILGSASTTPCKSWWQGLSSRTSLASSIRNSVPPWSTARISERTWWFQSLISPSGCHAVDTTSRRKESRRLTTLGRGRRPRGPAKHTAFLTSHGLRKPSWEGWLLVEMQQKHSIQMVEICLVPYIPRRMTIGTLFLTSCALTLSPTPFTWCSLRTSANLRPKSSAWL